MMLKLFKENVRIALGSIRTQLLRTVLTVMIIAIGITALVSILTVVSALENTISTDFASMGANTFNIKQYENTTRNRGGNEREIASTARHASNHAPCRGTCRSTPSTAAGNYPPGIRPRRCPTARRSTSPD